jgi:hypothetical protein
MLKHVSTYLVILLETHLSFDKRPYHVVFLDINGKIEVFQDVHCLIALSALWHHDKQSIERAEFRRHDPG